MAAHLDTRALGQSLRIRRHSDGLSLDALSLQLGSPIEDLVAIEAGEDPHVNVALHVVKWLGLDFDDFIVDDDADVDALYANETHVAAFLRSDRDLKPESADDIEAVLRAAYARLSAA